MLKAKAKAAATAAAQKRKAAAAAAAAQEAAAAQAAAQAAGPSAASARGGRGAVRGVTQYWADSGAARLAPGGSIQRIGYDAGAFDEAFRVVCGGDAPGDEGQRVEGAVGVIPAGPGAGAGAGAGEAQDGAEGKELVGGKEKEGGEGYKTNKEDLAVILDNLDVPSALASHTLRAHQGDLAATLTDLAAPRAPAAAGSA
ncbi:uncharacterized protein RHOBADRAFT_53077 [Rhodotorula graminis WP1]|uniref:Nascent polypeptide-associated complex subunit alpha-like UBA domain-containing protein n=1 Tax=Rhodotorula graminis (strain WP1) TaxID=578459 RepID=A0A194S9L2_RHOGW|nr:uncharacterized protein RHOBADRAFT_53077 [Rhodotorula graminis WP1]KPV76086.1 hypothetical protein RHOBADRAFT_53077 [Rhodotorula graminis WP1]